MSENTLHYTLHYTLYIIYIQKMIAHEKTVSQVSDVIEYVHRCTFNMTNLNTIHKRKDRSRLYHVVEDNFPTTVKPDGNLVLKKRGKLSSPRNLCLN